MRGIDGKGVARVRSGPDTGPVTTPRPAGTDDLDAVRHLAVASGLFDEEDVDGVLDAFRGHLAGDAPDDRWWIAEADGRAVGAAYVGPEPFADRLWNLWFLAVDPSHHGGGVGTALVAAVEQHLRGLGEARARVLLVETSDQPAQDVARAFYAARGFEEEARIRDYYGPGDAKVVFWKSLLVG